MAVIVVPASPIKLTRAIPNSTRKSPWWKRSVTCYGRYFSTRFPNKIVYRATMQAEYLFQLRGRIQPF
jgi:hypothetical protein